MVLYLVLYLFLGVDSIPLFTTVGPNSAFQPISAIGTKITNFKQAGLSDVYAQYLPFSIFWTNDFSSIIEDVSLIYIALNGDILLFSTATILSSSTTFQSLCYNPVDPLNDPSVLNAHISVMKFNSPFVTTSGGIYVLSKVSSVVVSYENMIVVTESGNITNLYAQAEIFSNGNVELRYGANTTLKGNSFISGIADLPDSFCKPSPFGNCDQATGFCTSFPGNSGVLYGIVFQNLNRLGLPSCSII